MTDSISRQAAIEYIQKWEGYDENGRAIIEGNPRSIYRGLEQLPSAQPEQCWIPCGERLPVQNGIYVVTRTISDGFEYNNITDCCYFDGTNTWHDDTRVNHGRKYLADVVAWQPLPDPYWEEKS